MRTALLLALALATCSIVVAPTASACPDPDNPCDPPPMGICPDMEPTTPGYWKALLACLT